MSLYQHGRRITGFSAGQALGVVWVVLCVCVRVCVVLCVWQLVCGEKIWDCDVLPEVRNVLQPTRDNKRGDTQRLQSDLLGSK